MTVELVLMTILGCDDSGTDCRYIATLNQRWETIERCNAVSEKRLLAYRDEPYPVIAAVCQSPEPKMLSDLAVEPLIKHSKAIPKDPTIAGPAVGVAKEETRGLAHRAIRLVSKALPTAEGFKNIFHRPVVLVKDSYSWVARGFK